MRVKDLDGNSTTWKIGGEVVVASDNRPRSDLHKRCRKLLRELFPSSQAKEEVSIPVRTQQILYFDFYLPITKIAIEVHGKQHYEFTPFFHANNIAFRLQQARDVDKVEWCKINNITLVILPYSESVDEWRERITRARKGQNDTGDGSS